MRYVLDTNIILFYLKNERTKRFIEEEYRPFSLENDAIVSIVTIGEIRAIAKKNNWGERRIKAVESILDRLVVVNIKFGELLDHYAEIDAFSQGKLFGSEDIKFSAKNMGKNDLWIAATTALTNAKLLTSDKDFSHLHNKYFEVNLIENLDLKK